MARKYTLCMSCQCHSCLESDPGRDFEFEGRWFHDHKKVDSIVEEVDSEMVDRVEKCGYVMVCSIHIWTVCIAWKRHTHGRLGTPGSCCSHVDIGIVAWWSLLFLLSIISLIDSLTVTGGNAAISASNVYGAMRGRCGTSKWYPGHDWLFVHVES